MDADRRAAFERIAAQYEGVALHFSERPGWPDHPDILVLVDDVAPGYSPAWVKGVVKELIEAGKAGYERRFPPGTAPDA